MKQQKNKDKPLKLFRYSGNKTKFPKIDLPDGTKRLVEPFCGSMGFSLQYDMPALGMDISSEIIDLLKWLKTVDEKSLDNLRIYEGNRIDVRKVPELTKEERSYLRINIASVCVGQLSSYTIYPQHKLPVDEPFKKSKKGHMKLVGGVDGHFHTVNENDLPQLEDKLGTVFEDGVIKELHTLEVVRNRAKILTY